MAYASGIRDFPFYITEATSLDEVKNRPGITLAKLFNWYYLVKKWDVVIEVKGSAKATMDLGSVGSIEAEVDSTISSSRLNTTNLKTDEPSLYIFTTLGSVLYPVTPTPTANSQSDLEQKNDTTPGPPPTSFHIVSAGISLAIESQDSTSPNWQLILTDVKSYAGLYYPLLNLGFFVYCSANAQENISPMYSAGVRHEVKFNSGTSTGTDLIPVNWDGVSFNLTAARNTYNNIGVNGAPINPYTLDATLPEIIIEINPSEYWPYDPEDTDSYPGKDGSGPVYNSSTGAQLRNPFNIVKRGDGTFYNPNYTP